MTRPFSDKPRYVAVDHEPDPEQAAVFVTGEVVVVADTEEKAAKVAAAMAEHGYARTRDGWTVFTLDRQVCVCDYPQDARAVADALNRTPEIVEYREASA